MLSKPESPVTSLALLVGALLESDVIGSALVPPSSAELVGGPSLAEAVADVGGSLAMFVPPLSSPVPPASTDEQASGSIARRAQSSRMRT